MNHEAKSIRPFLGAIDYDSSVAFYVKIGFTPIKLGDKMTYFHITSDTGFYLQRYYVKDWVDNSMVFLEVKDLYQHHSSLLALELTREFPTVKISDIVTNAWGAEYFLHDPSGILWHIGSFSD